MRLLDVFYLIWLPVEGVEYHFHVNSLMMRRKVQRKIDCAHEVEQKEGARQLGASTFNLIILKLLNLKTWNFHRT